MPGVDTRPIGSGSPPTAVSHASPPATSFTNFGAFSWYFDGSQLAQMSGGSRMWQSASTMLYFDIRPPTPLCPCAVELEHANGIAAQDLVLRLVVEAGEHLLAVFARV